MNHYEIIYIKNQLGHLWLKYPGIEINLPNAVDIYLLISKANYIRNEQE